MSEQQMTDDEVHDILSQPVPSAEEIIMRERLRCAHIEVRSKMAKDDSVDVVYDAGDLDGKLEFCFTVRLRMKAQHRAEFFSAPTLDGAVNLALRWLERNGAK